MGRIRRGFWTGLVVLWVAGWGVIPAVPAVMIGSPIAGLPQGSLAQGFEGSMVNRSLVFGTGAVGDIDLVKARYRIDYGADDLVNVFVTFGVVNDDLRSLDFNGLDTELRFKGESSFTVGAGLKLTFFENPRFLVGGGAQFEQFRLAGFDSLIDLADADAPRNDIRLKWKETVIFLGAHLKNIPHFVPYGGLFASVVRGTVDPVESGIPSVRMEERRPLGLFYGGIFNAREDIILMAEIHLVAETSAIFSVRYLF